MAKPTREEREKTKADRVEAREWRDFWRRWNKPGKPGIIVVRSADGAPISRRHLDLLQPAE